MPLKVPQTAYLERPEVAETIDWVALAFLRAHHLFKHLPVFVNIKVQVCRERSSHRVTVFVFCVCAKIHEA